jgi:hypothetical protein
MLKKILIVTGVLVVLSFALVACAGPAGPQGPEGPQGPAGPQGEPGAMPAATDLACTECHNDTTLVSAKVQSWELEKHGNGGAMAEEYGNKSCAGCHSGNSFSAMIAAGQNFSQVEAGATEPARQDCRACHQVHTTYTGADWALETTAPVTMVVSGLTFDKGNSNLCANCHQARRYMANFVDKNDATKFAATIRFNPHLSPQADFLMGSGGSGVEGKPGAHYAMLEDSCVACHLGEGNNHLFEAQLATCQGCHTDAESLDVNGAVTKIEERMAELKAALQAAGLLDADGAPVPGSYDEKQATALWNYGAIEEDGSNGVHNPNYVNALLDAAFAALGQ